MKTLLRLCEEIIRELETAYTRDELIGECPFKDLYLNARAARYQINNAPEAFQKGDH